jgi:hypothetical protein
MTKAQLAKAAAIIASKYADSKVKASDFALYPVWEGMGGSRGPAIVLEGGPYGRSGMGWAVEMARDPDVMAYAESLGLFPEPFAGYALGFWKRRGDGSGRRL